MKTFLFTFIILIGIQCIFAQWTWLNPTPQGNYLKQVIQLNNGNIIASGDYGTISISTNSGTSWQVIHKLNDTSAAINSLYRLSDNLIFAGSNDSKIFRSTNAGLNWIQISRITSQSSPDMEIFFTDNQNGFAYSNHSFYKTTNGGFNWSFVSQYQQQSCEFWFVDTNTGFAAGGSIVDNQMLTWCHKTTNGGQNWVSLNFQDIGPVSDIQFLNANTGYLSGYNSIFKTTNSGTNWFVITPVNTFSRINCFYFFNESIAYVGTDNSNFFKTSNGGANWNSVLIPYHTFNSYSGINNFSFSDQQNGSALMHNHIIVKTTNSGVNWSLHTNSFNLYTPLKAMEFIDNNTAFLGGWATTSDHIIYKSSNTGINWEGKYLSNYQNATGYIYDIEFPSFSTGYAVGGRSGKGYVYKSTTSGENWLKMDSIGSGEIYQCCFLDNNTGFAVGYFNQIYKTTNGAVSWSAYPVPVTTGLFSIFFTSFTTGFACGGNSPQLVFKTTNAGANWNQVFSATSNSFSDLFFINSTTGFVSAKGIFKTTDAGITWVQKLPNNLIYFYQSFFPSENIGYASAQDGRIFKTTNSGENWGELNSPTDLSFADMYFLNDNTGYFVGDQGMIIKTTNGGGNFINAINDPLFEVPGDYRLSQNFPNPFNPVTIIGFSVPKYSQIRISVYDILGKEIEVILNEFRSPGNYNVEWNADKYASGVYFYELSAGEFTERKKMVLVK